MTHSPPPRAPVMTTIGRLRIDIVRFIFHFDLKKFRDTTMLLFYPVRQQRITLGERLD